MTSVLHGQAMDRPALRVEAPGLLTTLQDYGRKGYQHLGVPVSGALDPDSLAAANLLAGNAMDTGALEIACTGPTLVVEADAIRVGIAGAEALIEAAGGSVRVGQSLRLCRGESLRIGAIAGGGVTYLAVEGGFGIAPVLGSVATDIRSGFGGWQGRALVAGDCLPLNRAQPSTRDELALDVGFLRPRPCIRVIKGPQDDHFADCEVAAFLDTPFTIGARDRMGLRLLGRALVHGRGFNIVSDGIAPGSIQVPGDGRPIVLLADRQTTGGYPKIATVISADLPALARLPVGATVRFETVTVEAAHAARRAYLAERAALAQQLIPLRLSGAEVASRLQDCNLVSGFVDAAA